MRPVESSLSSLLRAHAQARPGRAAYTQLLDGEREERTLTWAELDQRADSLAAALSERTQSGDRVLVVLPQDLDYIVAILGCARAGRVAVPVYPPDPANPQPGYAHIQAVARDAGVMLGLTCAALRPLAEGIGLDLAWLASEAIPAAAFRAEEPGPDALAVLLYTSGSTGAPKGVMLSHRNLLHAARAMSEDTGLDSDSVLALWLPLYHVSGLFSVIVLPLWNAARMVFFAPRLFVERPARWLQAISHYRATLSGCPTFAYDLVRRSARPEELAGLDLSSLRTLVVGGEAVLAEVLDAFTERLAPFGLRREVLYTMFGLTEAAMISTGSGLGQGYAQHVIDGEALAAGRVVEAAPGPGARSVVGSGRALPGVTVAVVDPARLEVLGDAAIGEIWISGDSVARGYWQRPDLTEATFGARTRDGAGPYLRTGDMGYWQAGQVHITGRLKEIVIIRGINHYPEDLETSVRRAHPDLAQAVCAAFAIEREGREALGIALERPGLSEAEARALADAIRRRIAADHGIQIAALAACRPGELPRTATGKLQRRRCAERLDAGAWDLWEGVPGSAVPASALPDTTPERLRHWVARRLGVVPDAVPLDQPLAGLGLDSVQVVGLVLDARAACGASLPVSRWYEARDLAELAAFLDGAAEPEDAAAEAARDAVLGPFHSGFAECRGEFMRPHGQDGANEFAPTPWAPYSNSEKSAVLDEPAALLLTGVTGFLGGYLARELLRGTRATVYCLVRAADPAAAQARLAQTLAAVGLDEAEWRGRAHAVPGDLAAPGLGLMPELWANLAEQVDALYHNGAAVDFVAPYAQLRAANVGAVRECLRFATHIRPKALHFTSTLAVFNGPERLAYSSLSESDRFPRAEQAQGGYARSKWVAEALLDQAAALGLPVTVHRAGFVIGDSATGRWNTEDFLCRLIKGSIQLGAYPDIDLDLAVAPVDWVAQAIVALTRPGQPAPSVSHLLAPEELPLRQLMAWVQDAGYALQPMPYARWRRVLSAALPADNALYPVLPFLIEPVAEDGRTLVDLFIDPAGPKFDARATQGRLAALGQAGPSVGAGPFARSLEGFIRTGFLPPTHRGQP
jgi:thioester reductase-like protein